MNITALVDLHLHSYLVANRLSDQAYPHLRRQINEGQDLQDRKNMDGHVTSSFALLNPSKTELLMIHHRGFDKWLFPGGHYEGMVSPRTSALRELEEETGFPADLVDFLDPNDFVSVDLDTHPIQARPDKDEGYHWHHDFLYLGVARDLAPLTHQVEEVLGAKWISLYDASQLPDERVMRAVFKIICKVRQS